VVKDLKFRILIDNTSSVGLLTEHGFAVWVECDDKIILFDTGQNTDNSDILFNNAEALGCDLAKVDMLVLSHGHYDHTGSISELLAINPTVTVVCHPQALMERRYSIYPDKAPRQIAMPEKHRLAIQSLPDQQVRLLSEAEHLFPGVGFSGAIPRKHQQEDTGGPFFLDEAKITPDLINDDISLWFETEQGLAVLTGCCHSGLINTVRHIQHVTGEQKIAGIIGGLHLNRAAEERLQVTRDAIHQWQPDFVIPCHCTGEAAIDFLKVSLGEKVVSGGSGFYKSIS
jgi:7,8-dihydropterin-6-yl-methyl-4-(beta-D-ribofuranosyl)aminobenzene 5'-phosphate synthase